MSIIVSEGQAEMIAKGMRLIEAEGETVGAENEVPEDAEALHSFGGWDAAIAAVVAVAAAAASAVWPYPWWGG
jgi:hypothetical protein